MAEEGGGGGRRGEGRGGIEGRGWMREDIVKRRTEKTSNGKGGGQSKDNYTRSYTRRTCIPVWFHCV